MIINTKKVQKPWGDELWIANNRENDYCGKILNIKPGSSTSLHFHSKKHETFYVLEGNMELTTIDTETAEESITCLNQGDAFSLDRNIPHRLQSSSGASILEVSTFHEDCDSYRVFR